MSDYKERVERLKLETAERLSREQAEQEARIQATLAEIEEYLDARRRLVEDALGEIDIESMLEDANRSVWNGVGHLQSEVNEDSSYSRFVVARYSLSAHKAVIIPETKEIRRLGLVWVQDEAPSVQPDWEGGGKYHRGIGMKRVEEKVVGSRDVGGETTLDVEIRIPLRPQPYSAGGRPADRGRVIIKDTDFDWSEELKNNLSYPPFSDQPGYDYYAGLYGNNLAARGAVLDFPPIDFDVDTIRQFADTSILLASAARSENS